jgi:hypothetical protein
MGLFSKKTPMERMIEKATNKLAQSRDREDALRKLEEDGTDEALFGLCKRFGITSTTGVDDVREKHWVRDTLVLKGPVAIPSLRRYMKNAEQIALALEVVERVAAQNPTTVDKAKVFEVIDEIFAVETPGYVRMPDRRIDLIKWLTSWKDATDDEVITRVKPYLPDFDENVRFAAIEGLSTRDPGKVAPLLVDALLRSGEDSGRIRRTIVEALERTRAPLGDRAAQVAAMLIGPLAQDYKVDGGLVKKK